MSSNYQEEHPHESLIDNTHPVDILEPIEEKPSEYRQAALKFTMVISLALSYILSQNCSPSSIHGVCFALGICETKSMRTLAKELNVSVATISNHARTFAELADLPPSILMKSEDHNTKLRNARNEYCQ